MTFKMKALSAAMISAFGAAGSAQAVVLSEDGRGQALLYPYYTVQGGTDTLISVVNTTTRGKAVKVRILEGRNSREVLDFNLYLSPNDVWTAAITRDADGNGKLLTNDRSCTAPAIPAGGVSFRNFQYSGSNSDRAGDGLNRAREGYIEMIEMGETDPASTVDLDSATGGVQTLHTRIIHSAGVPASCPQVVAAWTPPAGVFLSGANATNALTAPAGGIVGSGTLINVAQGTDYSYDPVALDAVLSTVFHTDPGSILPSLANADPVSSVFQPLTGTVVNSTWLRGAEAVSSVLQHLSVINEYTVESGLNAGTDWVVNFPTKRFHVPLESQFPGQAVVPPFTVLFDDTEARGTSRSATRLAEGNSSGACEPMSPQVFDREEATVTGNLDFSPLPPQGAFALCWEVNVVTFNNTAVLGSQILGSNFGLPTGFQNGWMKLSFLAAPTAEQEYTAGHSMSSLDGDTYFGLPAIGFAVQKYVNGNVGGVLSNYGGSFIHKYERAIIGG